MKPIRVALETSITRFIGSGIAVYARELRRALAAHTVPVEVVPLDIPAWMDTPPHPLLRKLGAAYWQIAHARTIVPLRARELHCDLVHYTMMIPIPPTMPCPTVATLHDIIPFVHPEWLPPLRGARMRRGMQSAVNRATHIVADSAATRRDALAFFDLAPERITTVLLGFGAVLPQLTAAAARALVAERYKLAAGYILCVGSLEPRKNIERVIEVCGHLQRRDGAAPHLVVVGANIWRHEHIRSLVAANGLAGRVHFTGHVPATDLAALFRCAGVFVYPSLYEGFGLPPLEAMSCGCPVITSNVSSLPEVVGAAALTVDPHDTEQLAGAIQRVLHDRRLAVMLRRQGYERVKEFTWQRCAQATYAVYRQVLG